MARTKATLTAGARLSDYLSASLLARVYPRELIDAVLAEHGAASRRVRSLPASVSCYYCMALSFYPEAAYEEVFAVLAQGLALGSSQVAVAEIAKSSISAARQKLGWRPLQSVAERACVPLCDPKTQPHAFYAGLRLVALDGSHLEIADELVNERAFGRPGSRTGRSAYPQAQCGVLVECASHAILAANLGAYRLAEWAICQPLLAKLDASMLCLADRGFDGYGQWQQARDTGAELLWRCRVNRELPVLKALADGSYLSAIYPNLKARATREGEIPVRVIDYQLPGAEGSGERYRLLTTLLDQERAPALELATLYHERWEVEAVFDELKTHLLQRRRVLRSKTAEGVRQEFYGWVLAHYAVCWLMHEAASAHRLRQRQLSFTGHLQLIRRSQPHSAAFPPRQTATA
jgi:Insertion element 4 transposase N-terminal/Transposase DDE domain